MVILIFEGTDNLGKSTIINNFVWKYKNTRDIVMMHSTCPPKDSKDPFLHQNITFLEKAIKLASIKVSEASNNYGFSLKNIAFLDRAWAGEYVYGQIYRNGDPDKIVDMIKDCEKVLTDIGIDVVTVHLCASPEFVIAHDDNLSFSSNYDPEKRMTTVKKEIELFNKCFETYKPEHYIKVNVEGDNLNYRNLDEICNEISEKLKNENIEL